MSFMVLVSGKASAQAGDLSRRGSACQGAIFSFCDRLDRNHAGAWFWGLQMNFFPRLLVVVSSLLACVAALAGDATQSFVSGTVRDESGKAVAGATVMLYSVKSNWGLDNEVIETVRTNSAGAYDFAKSLTFLVPNGTDYNDHYVVVASQSDRAFGWVKITASEQLDEYDLVLAAPMKQNFVVTDSAGAPL